MKVKAEDLQVGDVIREPIKLRGAGIASIVEIEGQVVAYVTGHPDPEVTRFHSPKPYEFIIDRLGDSEMVVFNHCFCTPITRDPNCEVHKK